MRIAAVRTALSLRRGKREAVGARGTLPDRAASMTNPEVGALRRRYRDALKDAVQTALASLPDADRELLRLHVLEGRTVEQLGAAHGVHGSTISRRITRSRSAVLDETRRLLSRDRGISESELKSIVRDLRTDLEVSIQRILGGENE